MDESAIMHELQRTRRPISEAVLPDKPGIYAIFLKSDAKLPGFAEGGKLIYLGKAKKSLAKRDRRQHFKTGETGHSTVRRSVGAILREDLRLTAIPRTPKRTKQDLYCFKFTQECEEKLTKWMHENLEVGYFVPAEHGVAGSIREIEGRLLAHAKPPLDLDRRTRGDNPHAEKLQELRKKCRVEAERGI